MTTAQPGQEQRMERARDMLMRRRKDAESLGGSAEIATEELDEAIAALTRPTANLGEDGEPERHARKMRESLNDELPNGVGNTIDALLDRLILYREALGDAFGTLHYIYGTTDDDHEKRAAAEARDKIGAVLSRSGG